MEAEYKKALEIVETYEKELARIKQAVIALSEGRSISEYMDFDKSVFLEEPYTLGGTERNTIRGSSGGRNVYRGQTHAESFPGCTCGHD